MSRGTRGNKKVDMEGQKVRRRPMVETGLFGASGSGASRSAAINNIPSVGIAGLAEEETPEEDDRATDDDDLHESARMQRRRRTKRAGGESVAVSSMAAGGS